MESKLAFSKGSSVDGVWINLYDGDVHVYRDVANKAIVIGHNASKNVKFTSPAVVLSESGDVSVHTDDGSGNPQYRKLNPEAFAIKLAAFLASL